MPKRLITLSEEMLDAIEKAKRKDERYFSDTIRRLIAKALGRPELANTVQMGRPRKDGEE